MYCDRAAEPSGYRAAARRPVASHSRLRGGEYEYEYEYDVDDDYYDDTDEPSAARRWQQQQPGDDRLRAGHHPAEAVELYGRDVSGQQRRTTRAQIARPPSATASAST